MRPRPNEARATSGAVLHAPARARVGGRCRGRASRSSISAAGIPTSRRPRTSYRCARGGGGARRHARVCAVRRAAGVEGGDRRAVSRRVRRRRRPGAGGRGAARVEDGVDRVRAGDGGARRVDRAARSRLSRLPLGRRDGRGGARRVAAARRRPARLECGAGRCRCAVSQLSVEPGGGVRRRRRVRGDGRVGAAHGHMGAARLRVRRSRLRRPAAAELSRDGRGARGRVSSSSRCRSRTAWRGGGSASRSGTRSSSRASRICRTTSSPASSCRCSTRGSPR